MTKTSQKTYRAGIFVAIALALFIVIILRVSQGGLMLGGSYTIYLNMSSALGINKGTPVQIAGVEVGSVRSVKLGSKDGETFALIETQIKSDYIVGSNAKAAVKTTGILGDAYIEIFYTEAIQSTLKDGGVISNVQNFGDFNTVTNQISDIADDIKAITKQMRKLMAGDESSFNKSMKNIEAITESLKHTTTHNQRNIDAIIANFKSLSQQLNTKGVNTLGNIEDITRTIAQGEGTVGKLIKDDTTINKINDSLDGINNLVGGVNRIRVDLGMHTEYHAGVGDFKNYVELYLRPRPDKFFLFELVSDPDPSYDTNVTETTVASGGNTSTITTTERLKQLNGLRFSAQIGKKFGDFTLRGGLIESSGGVGLDYDKGPFGASFQAFDFKSDFGEKAHLKAWARAQLTSSLYIMGGADDFINPNQDLAWFMGAGLRFTDDDIKSLLGLLATSSAGAGVR